MVHSVHVSHLFSSFNLGRHDNKTHTGTVYGNKRVKLSPFTLPYHDSEPTPVKVAPRIHMNMQDVKSAVLLCVTKCFPHRDHAKISASNSHQLFFWLIQNVWLVHFHSNMLWELKPVHCNPHSQQNSPNSPFTTTKWQKKNTEPYWNQLWITNSEKIKSA